VIEFPKWVTGHGGVPTIVSGPAHEAAVLKAPDEQHDDDVEHEKDRQAHVVRFPGSETWGSTAPTDDDAASVCAGESTPVDAVDPSVADPGTRTTRDEDASSSGSD
jgi:hypothetical protein